MTSRNGDRLDAVYRAPEGSGPFPAIVMLHGCSGLFNKKGELRSREEMWIARFNREGWATLLPDSFGSRGHGSFCSVKDRPVTAGGTRREDALGALDFLIDRPEIDPKRIVLAGWSNGAMTALKLLRKGNDLTPKPGAPDFMAAVLFYPGCRVDLKKYPDYMLRLPSLLQMGEADDWTFAPPCLELLERSRNAGLIDIDIYPRAYHSFDNPTVMARVITVAGGRKVHSGGDPLARALAVDRTVGWLKEKFDKDQ